MVISDELYEKLGQLGNEMIDMNQGTSMGEANHRKMIYAQLKMSDFADLLIDIATLIQKEVGD